MKNLLYHEGELKSMRDGKFQAIEERAEYQLPTSVKLLLIALAWLTLTVVTPVILGAYWAFTNWVK